MDIGGLELFHCSNVSSQKRKIGMFLTSCILCSCKAKVEFSSDHISLDIQQLKDGELFSWGCEFQFVTTLLVQKVCHKLGVCCILEHKISCSITIVGIAIICDHIGCSTSSDCNMSCIFIWNIIWVCCSVTTSVHTPYKLKSYIWDETYQQLSISSCRG